MTEAKPGRVTIWLNRFEDALLSVFVLALVLLGGLQIVLRNVFESGLIWIDPLLRVSVLWLGLIGAVAAARRNKNIRIDLLSRYLPDAAGRWVDAVTGLFAAAVCGLIGWHGWRMVKLEAEFGDTGVLDLPIWLLQSVIPVSFAVMALIYLVAALASMLGKTAR